MGYQVHSNGELTELRSIDNTRRGRRISETHAQVQEKEKWYHPADRNKKKEKKKTALPLE